MTITESLLVIAAFCGAPTTYRLENKHVNTCREAFFDCVGMQTMAKAVSLPQHEKELARKVLGCAKERKLVE